MRGRRRLLLVGVFALVLGVVSGAGAGQTSPTSAELAPLARAQSRASYVPGELLVRFRSGTTASERSASLAVEGARPAGGLGVPGLALVKIPARASVDTVGAELEEDPSVIYAEPNYIRRYSVVPDDPMFDQLYGLSQVSDSDIDAPEAWDTTTGSSGVVVAVIDSGVSYRHPDLDGNIWTNDDPPGGGDDDSNGFVDDLHGWDFVQDDATPLDLVGHGTHVAGTIGAEGNNGTGVVGVNWDVSIMPVRAGGLGGLTDSNIVKSIGYACANGADVVNGSFGGPDFSTSIANAINSPACTDTLFVFAAGNDGRDLDANTRANNSYPCEYHRPAAQGGADATNLLCVAATGKNDAMPAFSNHGTSAVHLAAPGVDIRSTFAAFSVVPGFPDGFEGSRSAFNRRWGARTGSPDWDRTKAREKNGKYSLTDSPGGDYPNGANNSIRNRRGIDLGGKMGCGLDYEMWLKSERGRDGVLIYAGHRPSSFQRVAGWAGSTGGRFRHLFEDLSFLDGDSSAYLRFRFKSDRSKRLDGVYLDNLVVTCLNQTANAYATLSGTSMATPHVSGVAALLLASDATLTVAELKAAILGGVDVLPGLAGSVSTSGRLNADQALDLVP